ncbi:MAG: hypothetical protein ACI8QS_002403 [Planctomycetota bacterium]
MIVAASSSRKALNAGDVDLDGDIDHVTLEAFFNGSRTFHVTGNLASVALYGAALNPPRSLLLQGEVSPTVGMTSIFEIDNPLGTQSAGSLSVLVTSLAPAAGFPSGTLFSGFGMTSPGADGELLVSLSAPDRVPPYRFGSAWGGPSLPALVSVDIPPLGYLAGLRIYAQGLLVDISPGAPVPFGLTSAIRFTVEPGP